MPEPGFLAAFLIGLLGGTHCVGMCGGIVGALTVQLPGARPQWTIHLAYNLGRIASYALAGAIVGGIGGASLSLDRVAPVQWALHVFANLMLIALGLYLAGVTRALAMLERWGGRLWARIQPLAGRFVPVRSAAGALPLGALWGFLPCGLVYGVLASALAAGSALRGAGLMLAFGLGTLPNLLLAGMVLVRLRGFARARVVRVASGLLVLGFGILGLARAVSFAGVLSG
jgi:hypothetical protein